MAGAAPMDVVPPPPPAPTWLLVWDAGDGEAYVARTTRPDAMAATVGVENVLCSVPADRVVEASLRVALSVWDVGDGLYRLSAPVRALCDALEVVSRMADHRAAVDVAGWVARQAAAWWTSVDA